MYVAHTHTPKKTLKTMEMQMYVYVAHTHTPKDPTDYGDANVCMWHAHTPKKTLKTLKTL